MNRKMQFGLVLSVVVVMALLATTATAAFAMPIDDAGARWSATRSVTREESVALPAASQVAAPQSVAALQAVTAPRAVALQPATVSVYVGPDVVAAAQPEDRSGAVETEKSATESIDASNQLVKPLPASDDAAPQKAEVEHGPEVEFKGTVASITGVSPTLTLMVSGRVVTTTAQTVFLNPIAVGNFVEVDGFLQADQSVWARKIKLEDNPLVELEVEFRGSIAVLPAGPAWLGQWVVAGYTVTVDANTNIDTRRGQPAIGAIAEVKANRQPDNSLLAVRIKIEDAAEFQNEIEFKGTISALTGSGPYTMQVAGHTVTTNGATVISGTLANGALVEVQGALQPDNSVLATRIHVEDPVNDELEFISTITTLPANFIGTWTFGNGQTVIADANTLIDQSRGAALAGALAEVKAVKQLNGTWLAVRIQVEDN
jgi:hypothetical protein